MLRGIRALFSCVLNLGCRLAFQGLPDKGRVKENPPPEPTERNLPPFLPMANGSDRGPTGWREKDFQQPGRVNKLMMIVSGVVTCQQRANFFGRACISFHFKSRHAAFSSLYRTKKPRVYRALLDVFKASNHAAAIWPVGIVRIFSAVPGGMMENHWEAALGFTRRK